MIQKNRWWPLTLIESICTLVISSVAIGIMLYFRAPVLKEDKYKSEPKSVLGAISRGQIAYYLAEGHFTADIGNLQLGIADETTIYSYQTQLLSDFAVKSVAIAHDQTIHENFIGLLLVGKNSNDEMVTKQLGCESRKKAKQKPLLFSLPDNFDIEAVKCPNGYRPIWDVIRPFP